MKNLRTFEQFVNESNLNDNELDSRLEVYEMASFGGRAWSGKLENIDNLLSWMYDKGILTKSEQAEKDSRFRQYYRYYNDGDFPKGLSSKGVNRYSPEAEIEKALEEHIEEFIKRILAKYTGKYDRKDFRIDTLLGDLKTLSNITGGHTTESNGITWEPDPHGLLNYWGSKIKTGNSEFEKMLGELRPLYDDAKKAANFALEQAIKNGAFGDVKSYNLPGSGSTISYIRERLQEIKAWPSDAEKKYSKMKDHMLKMNDILNTVIEATERTREVFIG